VSPATASLDAVKVGLPINRLKSSEPQNSLWCLEMNDKLSLSRGSPPIFQPINDLGRFVDTARFAAAL
jgi:hypothetical protein